ncbi:hypothetical protein ANO11243_061780 [Dothideomycetidae sp. 11243]|nr:hypothetical protein ANO11243_061780 [fungal sp. No.11243]
MLPHGLNFILQANKEEPWRLSTAIVLALAVLIVACFLASDKTDVPHISHLPSVPGLPLFGNLIQLGTEQPRRLQELSKTLGPVFQIRLGNKSPKRFVVANDFKTIKKLWIENQSNLISRPKLHTFHNVLSSSQAYTVGTSPWDDSCKLRRKHAATALNRPSVKSYMPFVDLESYTSIKELMEQIDDKAPATDLNAYALFQRLALNLSLTLGFGFRIDGDMRDDLLTEIITVERGISTLRSTSNNWQDFVPFLRLLSRRTDEAEDLRRRRDVYLELLLQRLKEKIAGGSYVSCITGNILQDPDCKLNHTETKSLCVTMIAGGLDTTPACLWLGLAMLTGAKGRQMQQRLLSDINNTYPDGDAWEACLNDEKAGYVMAFCKEVLRFWTVIPLSLPRTSTKDLEWEGAVIPAGTTFLMNAWAANFDQTHFEAPSEFDPDRFLNIPEGSGTQHFAFGAGSRMCTGSHLAYREMYVTFVRMLLAFDIVPCANPQERPILVGPLECNANPSGLSIEPTPFKIGFKVRNEVQLQKWLKGSEARTAHLA